MQIRHTPQPWKIYFWGRRQQVPRLHDHTPGIEANPDKCTAILKMHNPTNIQEVQKLNDRLPSLSKFLPKLAKKAKPFYKLLKKTKSFSWDKTREQAFLAFKKTIATPPILSRPRLGAPLLLYLLVADKDVSLALVQKEGKHQLPIFFTSHMLRDIEKRYQMIKKVALALVTSTRRLRPYFQSHQVVVKMNYPIKQVLRKPELVGRMVA